MTLSTISTRARADGRSHVFLGTGHERNERRTWIVIILCGVMMLVEIVGGLLFGSIALVADGLHMSTHAGALLLAALAYSFSRRYAHDPRFSFGTGKLGDLAGFTSAIVLAMIAMLIGYESVTRFISPIPIHFGQAIPIAVLGLCANIVSAWLLGGGSGHHHGHSHGHEHEHAEDGQTVVVGDHVLRLDVFEDDVPPRFRISSGSSPLDIDTTSIETVRPDGARQNFPLVARVGYLESFDEIPEPHAFTLQLRIGGDSQTILFEEHGHSGTHHRDNNMRAAVIHVLADAAVSVLVIVGLVLARLFGWLWMDPVAGLIGAVVIASWSYGLIRDTGAILLDMTPDGRLADRIRNIVESNGDVVSDLHLWRLGPGHLGAILSIATKTGHDAAFYHARLGGLSSVSHLTVEVTAGRT